MTIQATGSVVVIYENPATRERAVAFCDRLVERFWARLGFDISWWSFSLLEDANSSREATDRAAEADLVLFATESEGAFPLRVTTWIETWLDQRGDREGALVALLPEEVSREAIDNHLYLRRIAHRAGMDYLTGIPQSLSRPFPDSPESYSERAAQVTSLLEEILRPPTPPQAVL